MGNGSLSGNNSILDGKSDGNTPAVSASSSHTAKNPIMLLNELRQGVEYTLVREAGEPHARVFTYAVTVDGQTFEGTGMYFYFVVAFY